MDQRLTRDNEHGVGALLRATRQRCGEDLSDVARVLRIRLLYLEAIENGRYADLPGPTYAVGFVRAYADHLGLDGAEVVRRFKSETSTAIAKPRLAFPVPIPESSVPTGAIMFVGALIAVVAYGTWYLGTSKDNLFTSVVAPLPGRLAETIKGKESTTATATPSPLSASSATAASRPSDPAPVAATKEESVPSAAPSATSAPAPAVSETVAARPSSPASPAAADVQPVPAPSAAEQSAPSLRRSAVVETPVRQPEVAVVTPADRPTEPQPSAAPAEAAPSPQPSRNSETAAVIATAPSSAEDGAAPATSINLARAEPKTKPPAPPAASPSSVAVPTQAGANAASASLQATDSAAPAANEPATRIMVRAKTNSWIQVRDDAANQLLLTRLLRAGDTYRIPDRSGLKLLTGNAGGIEIVVDGEVVPSIGPVGAVRRGVALDAEKLKSGTAVTE